MSSTEIAVREANQTVVLDNVQLKYISNTEFVPQGLRNNMPAILACVATGRSLGISDMTSLRSIHVIKGRASFSAELMVMLVRRAGHSIQGEVTDGAATITGKRCDNGDTMTYTFTREMAARAGLSGNESHKKYPESMLWARAVSQLCRMLFADCFAGGGTYTPEEAASVDGEELFEADTADFDSAPDPSELESGAVSSAGEPEADALPGTPEPVSQAAGREPASSADTPSAPMLKKLNTLVGKLRATDHDPTVWMYDTLGREKVIGEDGVLHWSPLRDSLTRDEASSLIESLDGFLAKLEVAA